MKRPGGQRGESIDAAFNRVLAAEREAREAVERCQRQAAVRIDHAEQQAAGIAERAARRIRSVREIADRGVERALATLHAPADFVEDEPQPPSTDEVDSIVSLLVRELLESPP
ncbi:MAG: hypothetical protein PVH47_01045 [Thiohalocapsa sp.]|jgi:hypothetical protein